ncbi:MAG: pyridoxamine 5'-phosphate oxidase family protein [Methylococcales bacterium]
MFNLFRRKPQNLPPAAVTLLPGSAGEHYLQCKYGTKQRALRFYDKQVLHYLSPVMKEFIANQEILFIATADKHGECDCSFRFGKPGFVRALDDNYLLYPEYRGNGVMASQGNISENPHIGMIFVDFFTSTVGLHVNGKAKLLEHDELWKFKSDLPPDLLTELKVEGKERPERWIMVEIEEAYIHCSKHIPLLKKADKTIAWGTDDDGLKRSDFFALHDIPLYQRIGGEPAIQAIADIVIRKLLQDAQLSLVLQKINLQTLLDKHRQFLKWVFGGIDSEQQLPDNLREFYKEQINDGLSEAQLDIAVAHLQNALIELELPEHEVSKLMTALMEPAHAEHDRFVT